MHHVVYVSLLLLLSAASRTSPSTVDPRFDYTGRSAEFKAAVQKCKNGVGYVRLNHGAQYYNQSLLDMEPPKFLREFSNPCWVECYPEDKDKVYHKDNPYWSHRVFGEKLADLAEKTSKITRTWRLRCLPKFYIIGVAKCGTTDLFQRISSHPDITDMGAKEITWWSSLTPLTNNEVFNFERYLDIADLAVDRILDDVRINPDTGQTEYPVIFGDGTPSTMFRNTQWNKYTGNIDNDYEQKFLTPLMMSHVQPDVKLIVILRDPVQMTFSSYKYFRMAESPPDVDEFHECVVHSIKAFLDCEKHHSNNWCSYIKRNEFNFTGNLHHCNFVLRSLQIGRYYSYLKEWFKFYPKEQFFVIKMEEYSLQTKKTIQEIWSFLGLTKLPLRFAQHIYELDKRNVSRSPLLKMKVATKKLLKTFFSKSNMKLAKMLNRREFLWLD